MSAAAEAADDTPPGLPRSAAGRHSPFLIAGIVAAGTLMEALGATALSVALPQLSGNLGVSTDEADYVLTIYLVAQAAIMPISAFAANTFGRKRFYIACIIAFTVASFLCGIAPSLELLIFFRVLQGVAAAGNSASEASIIADSFPPETRGAGFAIYGLAVVVGPVAGPVLGGLFVDSLDWRWIFFINIPVGILSVAASLYFLQDSAVLRQERAERWRRGIRFDYLGFALAVVGLGALELVLDEGQREDWFDSGFITFWAVVAGLSLLALPLWELTRKEPVIDFRLLANLNFLACCLVMFVGFGSLFGSTNLLPLMLQQVFGYNAYWAGLVLTVGGLSTLVLMPASGWLTSIVPAKWLLVVAFVFSGWGLMLQSGFYEGYGFWQLAAMRGVQTIAFAFLFVPLQAQAYVGLRPQDNEQASALLNVVRNLGGSVGVTLATVMVERRGQHHQSVLAESTDPSNPAWADYLAGLQAGFGNMTDAADAALAVAYQSLVTQAQTLAYNDVYWLFAMISFASIVLVLLMPAGKPGEGAEAGPG
ncbi:DHA2 family efflux MFS transporter permease subunit [Pararoseomonas sp. SCSIO 73927]|uniref:DHA2 family efflux MFS transporter permease subunit n=1 Tax=Pararoseomonas sp. SCSIO 73927 TaxID=3114537 RepID=UPI0030CDBC0D